MIQRITKGLSGEPKIMGFLINISINLLITIDMCQIPRSKIHHLIDFEKIFKFRV